MTNKILRLTDHYGRIVEFMRLAKQSAPSRPCIPGEKVRLLRAVLINEEAKETIRGLGCYVVPGTGEVAVSLTEEPDLVEIVDGCADISVVAMGTLIACGVPDAALLELVDRNNLAKFGPGHLIREDGKVIKPAGHMPPDIVGFLEELGWKPPTD